jgi:hypothetical protein
VVDGLIENPLLCDCNVASLACLDGSVSPCLPEQQLSTRQTTYAGPTNSCNQKMIYPGFSLGFEKEWLLQGASLYIDYTTPYSSKHCLKIYFMMWMDLNFLLDLVDKIASPLTDEIGADLSAFSQRGGRMIVIQDQSQTPLLIYGLLSLINISGSIYQDGPIHTTPQPGQ